MVDSTGDGVTDAVWIDENGDGALDSLKAARPVDTTGKPHPRLPGAPAVTLFTVPGHHSAHLSARFSPRLSARHGAGDGFADSVGIDTTGDGQIDVTFLRFRDLAVRLPHDGSVGPGTQVTVLHGALHEALHGALHGALLHGALHGALHGTLHGALHDGGTWDLG